MPPTRHAARCRFAAVLASLALNSLVPAGQAQAAATIVINNINAPGVGFNDPTPTAPVGGNTGATLGQQRLIAFTHAARIWAGALSSEVPIVVQAQFAALNCSATAAVLGSAGATTVLRSFPNATQANTWYAYALANKLAGSDLGAPPAAQISASFNARLGLDANCLPGTQFYLGLDGQAGTHIDFVALLLHELAHGLGFQTTTSPVTGAQLDGSPSIWDHYLLDTVTGRPWKDLSDAERRASAVSVDKLVWSGAGVTGAIPGVLRFGLAGVAIAGPASGAAGGSYRVGEASFGPPLGSVAVTGELAAVTERTPGAGEACDALDATAAAAVNGRIALITRGVCPFVTKVKNAQNAGARAVLIADTVAEASPAPSPLGGSDPSITIPAARVFLGDALRIREAMQRRSRTASGVFATLGLVIAQYAGADPLGRALMFAPGPVASGASVSHFDSSMLPDQLMEPGIGTIAFQPALPPQDLTIWLFQDIGW